MSFEPGTRVIYYRYRSKTGGSRWYRSAEKLLATVVRVGVSGRATIQLEDGSLRVVDTTNLKLISEGNKP